MGLCTCERSAYRGQKRASDPELELQVLVSHRVGVRMLGTQPVSLKEEQALLTTELPLQPHPQMILLEHKQSPSQQT